jgi:hypothetical protein
VFHPWGKVARLPVGDHLDEVDQGHVVDPVGEVLRVVPVGRVVVVERRLHLGKPLLVLVRAVGGTLLAGRYGIDASTCPRLEIPACRNCCGSATTYGLPRDPLLSEVRPATRLLPAQEADQHAPAAPRACL